MCSIQEKTIIDLGKQVRNEIPEPLGYCFEASKLLRDKLKKKYDLTDKQIEIKEVYVGYPLKIRHYVIKLKSNCLSKNYSSYTVLIDVTLDQYCDKNYDNNNVKQTYGLKENIPEVNIFEPGGTPYDSI